ncbi:MAG TPA: lytic transglycosylase domain-containing protein [Blastocatellia bacterium]|nr:lytic transglycosylase domain-containing protein [Blastocatellia bacterium]
MRKKLLLFLTVVIVLALGAFGTWYYWTHRYDKLIAAAAQKYSLDPALVKAIVYEESFFRSQAQSTQNAIGLMQITPVVLQEWLEAKRTRTLREAFESVVGKAIDYEPNAEEALSNPAVSLDVGCWYLQTLLNRYRNEPYPLAVALAAYNAGPSNVERWVPNGERPSISRDEFIARIEFPATRNYVQKIIERYDYYRRDRDLKE